jgi:Fe2+ or Zn2+ uptake regulation protein
MGQAVPPAIQDELRQAGLPGQGAIARLLGLLRGAPNTHLGLAEITRMAAAARLAMAPAELARQLETLADLGLLGRLPSTAPEPVFDTVPSPHYHLIYEGTAETVDLDVSPETLLAILRQALADRPGRVDVLVRFRGDPATALDRAGRGRRAVDARAPFHGG